MNQCKICMSYSMHYAYTKKNKGRFLRCSFCELIISEISINTANSEDFGSLDHMINKLSKVDPGKTILIDIPLSDDPVGLKDSYSYCLARKSLYIILNRMYFTDVIISSKNYYICELSCIKKIQSYLKISFVVAAYNEEKTIKKVIEELIELDFKGIEKEIIVVESNSTDLTRYILKKYHEKKLIKLILQDKPKGKGNAVREGIKNTDGDFICIQDADSEYDIEDYYNLIPCLVIGGESFVLGTRHSKNGWKMRKFENQPIRALLLNIGQIIFTKLINSVTKQNMTDPFTMFKLFRKDAIKTINFESNRFDFDHELVIKLIRNKNIPLEIPINYMSRSFADGKKIKVLRDPVNWLVAIFRYGIMNK